MCTRIEATSGADAKEAAETAEPRARLVASVKGVLASVCALDEERQFELFQLVASLEARYVPVAGADGRDHARGGDAALPPSVGGLHAESGDRGRRREGD